MKTLLTILTLFSFIACEAPQRTRIQQAYDSLGNPIGDGYKSSPDKDKDLPVDQPTNPPVSQLPSEYSHCDYSYKYHTIDIGHFAICQSRTDETKFRFRTQMSNQHVQVCLIPTYRSPSGSSTYLGNPQCTFTKAGEDHEGRLYKDRPGFSGHTINGVIVLKYGLHTSYYTCMNAAINWPMNACPQGVNTSQACMLDFNNCPYGSATNASCAAKANQYMTRVCEDFKLKYSHSYADISTR